MDCGWWLVAGTFRYFDGIGSKQILGFMLELTTSHELPATSHITGFYLPE